MKTAQRMILIYFSLWAFFISLGLKAEINPSAPPLPSVPESALPPKEELNKPKTLTEEPIISNKKDHWLCRKESEVRTIRVQQKEESCIGWYTKSGLDEQVVTSKNINNCSPMVFQVKGNLESAGWVCKDISDSKITK